MVGVFGVLQGARLSFVGDFSGEAKPPVAMLPPFMFCLRGAPIQCMIVNDSGACTMMGS